VTYRGWATAFRFYAMTGIFVVYHHDLVGAHTASCPLGMVGCSPVVKRPEREAVRLYVLLRFPNEWNFASTPLYVLLTLHLGTRAFYLTYSF
jgi:hypothetical protein